MRLWHYDLLPKLPIQWLIGQHRECCALRGKGWGKKHSTVDYVFKHPYATLFMYHAKVMRLLMLQGVKIDPLWMESNYRGKKVGFCDSKKLPNMDKEPVVFYPEHNDIYYQECIDNLKEKGIII